MYLKSIMKRKFRHIIIPFIAILLSGMAGITNVVLNSKIQDTIALSHQDASHQDTQTTISVLTHHTPYILTSQEQLPSFLLQSGSKTQTTFRADALHLQTYLYTAYKKSQQEKAMHFSQLRSDGHYLYALCQMRI